jgi:enoyl-CoA hydratase
MLLTGDTIDGRTAKAWGLVYDAVPAAELDPAVEALAQRMAGVPKNQLMMQKMMINQAYENMGLASTQTLATLFDGITRHSPEGVWFKGYAEEHGFHAAVQWRDSGRPIPEGEALKRGDHRDGAPGSRTRSRAGDAAKRATAKGAVSKRSAVKGGGR